MDYGKWSGMAFDEDEDDDKPRKPRVTRLEGPAQITLGAEQIVSQLPAGVEHKYITGGGHKSGAEGKAKAKSGFDYSRWDSLDAESDDEGSGEEDDRAAEWGERNERGHEDELDDEERHQLQKVMAKAEVGAPSTSAPSTSGALVGAAAPSTAATRHTALLAHLTRNGAHRGKYLWRQSEVEVELSVVLPAGARAKQLQIELLLSDASHPKQRLQVRWRQWNASLFVGVLAYPVEPPGEDEELQWELTDFENEAEERLLRVTLFKKEVQGIVIWWGRACEDEEVRIAVKALAKVIAPWSCGAVRSFDSCAGTRLGTTRQRIIGVAQSVHALPAAHQPCPVTCCFPLKRCRNWIRSPSRIASARKL